MIVTAFGVVLDLLQLLRPALHSHARLAAENLFLRKQLALYIERKAKAPPSQQRDPAHARDARPLHRLAAGAHQSCSPTPWCAGTATPFGCSGVGSLAVGATANSAGPSAADRGNGTANRTWGEERIAAELLLKLGISVSPRTVRRYMGRPRSAHPGSRTQAWSTFVRNHARDVLACDFFVTVTARFRLLYVFVVLDVGTRRAGALERHRASNG